MRNVAALFVVLVLSSCGSDMTSTDGGAIACTDDVACDDGLFCNGMERCRPDEAGASAAGCVVGAPQCAGACDESADTCEGCLDADADGHQDIGCGGDDCDDTDPRRYPGNTEICDGDDRDEDCEGGTFGFRDADADGEADALCCNEEAGERVCGTDCNDVRPTVSTTSTEACDRLDNDCDGIIDESVLMTFHADGDGDGFGLDAETMEACSAPPGYAGPGGDCDDMASGVNPGLAERCDRPAAGAEAVDENCNGMANEDCECTEGATRPCTLPGLCASGEEICDSGTWSESCSITPEPETGTACDSVDNDCDGVIDEGLLVDCYIDGDNDTYAFPEATLESVCPVPGRGEVGGCPPGFTNRVPADATSGDCDDSLSSINPIAMESCIEGTAMDRDEDCDGSIDENVGVTCWVDADNDTYAPTGGAMDRCVVGGRPEVGGCPYGFTNRGPVATTIDCDDSAFNVNPMATEICDADMIDENCDGAANPSSQCACSAGQSRSCAMGGLLGNCAAGTQTCMSGTWSACSIAPVPETSCDGADNDCDGTADEGFAIPCYQDGDGDSYAPAGATVTLRCSCGPASNTTSRAPSSPSTTDCNDLRDDIYPGRTELCDRVDGNCSSGGGTDTSEDGDGDGHARSSAACSGGYPKDDCNDADARVFLGQTTYFSSARCDGHVAVNSACTGVFKCGATCLPWNLTNAFDFDCDGTQEPQAEALCRPITMGSLTCAPAGCTGDGPTNPQTYTSCGQAVNWSRCECNFGGVPFASCFEQLTSSGGQRIQRRLGCL